MITTFDPSPPFQSAHSRSKWATIFLKLCMVLTVASAVSNWFQVQLLSRVANGEVVTYMEESANDDRQLMLAGFYSLIFIITGILVLKWIHRSYSNLPALGAIDIRFTPKWAVGWFFFPILSLFRPFQAVAEIWKASYPEVDSPTGTEWKANPVSPLLGFWWAAWLAGNFLGAIASSMTTLNDLDVSITLTWLVLVSDIINIVAAALLIIIIRTITSWQQEKIDRLTLYEAPTVAIVPQAPVTTTPIMATSSIRRVPASWVTTGQHRSNLQNS